jgi:hypothetical protein
MGPGMYYSIGDLANLTKEARSPVKQVMRFLTRYGFVQQIGSEEPLFTKTGITLSPAESINMLKQLVTPKTA